MMKKLFPEAVIRQLNALNSRTDWDCAWYFFSSLVLVLFSHVLLQILEVVALIQTGDGISCVNNSEPSTSWWLLWGHCILSWVITIYQVAGCGRGDRDLAQVWTLVCVGFIYVPCFICSVCILDELSKMGKMCNDHLKEASYLFWLCMHLV